LGNKVAFNPQDRFLVTIGNTLMVTTQNGAVFGHDMSGHHVGEAFQFNGARAAFNPQDRFVVTMGNKLIVTTQSGDVFGHEVSGRTIGPAFKFTGSRAAFNPQDRFVVTMGNLLIVTTQNGDVFGHEVVNHNIGNAFKFSGSRAAFAGAMDRFVTTIGNTLIVITRNGDVFGHEVVNHNIGNPFKLTGSRAAFNGAVDRFVTTVGNLLVVTTQSGEAFGHDVANRNVGAPAWLNPSDTATFDAGPLTSDLPLGGSVHLVMRRNGNFTLTTHAHDSGFDNIDYQISAVLLAASGIAFTFQKGGHVEGTVAGLPFGTPDRDDDATISGENAMITREFDGIVSGARLLASLDGKDKLIGGITGMLGDLLEQAAKGLGKAAVAGAVALVA